MRAMVYDRYGPADMLHLEEMPTPAAKADQVVVKVHAASVNPVDWKIRRGELRLLTGRRFPRIPGIDFAGTLVEAGSAVKSLRPGEEVFGVLNAVRARYGTSAEYVATSAGQMAHKPGAISFLEAAAVPCAGLTAWHALRDLMQLRAGQRILVNGASGGVGSFAVQIAKELGAAVTATCSGANLDFVRELGADRTVDYYTQEVRNSTERFDAILDAAATLSYASTRHLLNARGVYVTTLPSPGAVFSVLATFMTPGKKAKIVLLNGRRSIPNALADLGALISSGRIRVCLGAVFKLEDLAQAHRTSETGHARGKIGIQVV